MIKVMEDEVRGPLGARKVPCQLSDTTVSHPSVSLAFPTSSLTSPQQERADPDMLNKSPARRRRIAQASGQVCPRLTS